MGGAGFIGSHVNEMLHRQGYSTVVLDNLSRGHRANVIHGTLIEGDAADSELLDQIFATYPIMAVMHFAAFKDVGESVAVPLAYYANNVGATFNLLQAMLKHGVGTFIFSSTAAIYGNPERDYIDEEHPCRPLNPYGQSKLIVESILPAIERAYGLRYCCLRYFNAAGGDPEGVLKNYNARESNLIQIALRSLSDPEAAITLFGTDYPTPDGTGIRDYVHVDDLGQAHILAMERLIQGAPSRCYNLGNEHGFSVREVIATVEAVTGGRLRVVEGKRRPGDAAVVIASAAKARRELGWQPRYSSLRVMIEHAWRALQACTNGV